MGSLEHMSILGSMSFGASGHLGQIGTWGEMATRKNEHQSKWAFGANRYMGQMGIECMWGLRQMDIWMNEHFGVKRHFGTNEHWGKWAFGA